MKKAKWSEWQDMGDGIELRYITQMRIRSGYRYDKKLDRVIPDNSNSEPSDPITITEN